MIFTLRFYWKLISEHSFLMLDLTFSFHDAQKQSKSS